MAFVENYGFDDQPDRPELYLVGDVSSPDTDLKGLVYAWLDDFRAKGTDYDNDQVFGRHGLKAATEPNPDGSTTDYAYITTPAGYYRVEQTRGGDKPTATYLSLVTESGTFYPPAGVALEGAHRSTFGPNGGDSISPDQLSVFMLRQFTTDLQSNLG